VGRVVGAPWRRILWLTLLGSALHDAAIISRLRCSPHR
jgi:hypothetical protein